MNFLGGLNEEQYSKLKDAPVHITILIAGADGKIDEQELNWAEKLTHIRTYAQPEELNTYYTDVEDSFDDKISDALSTLPSDLNLREKELSERLSALNEILACLDNSIAFKLYDSFVSFAKHIAKASGGFLRFGSISSQEKEWIDLPMIEPIILEIPEDEDPVEGE